MARIAGVDLPREKRVEIGLTYIYGIGRGNPHRIQQKDQEKPENPHRDLHNEKGEINNSVVRGTQKGGG